MLAQPVPSALGRRAPGVAADRFWWLWTRAEARAKVLDVPIVVWLSRVEWTADAGGPAGGATDGEAPFVLSYRLDDLVVSHAVAAVPPSE